MYKKHLHHTQSLDFSPLCSDDDDEDYIKRIYRKFDLYSPNVPSKNIPSAKNTKYVFMCCDWLSRVHGDGMRKRQLFCKQSIDTGVFK